MFLTFLLSLLLLFLQQLASLETNLFASGMIRFYDQHSDMRLDIDNMSYEVSLASFSYILLYTIS